MNFRIFSIEFYPYVNSEEWYIGITNLGTDIHPETFLEAIIKKVQWENLDLEVWTTKTKKETDLDYCIIFRTQKLTLYFFTNHNSLFNLSQSKELRDRYFHIVEGIFGEPIQ